MSSWSLNVFKTPDKMPKQKKKPIYHRTFSNLDNENMVVPIRKHWKIAKTPFKVLDAPALKDDYYLNLLDWSSQNVLAVGLASNIYLWSAATSRVTKLTDLGQDNSVASIAWSNWGSCIGIGTNDGSVQIWDVNKEKMVWSLCGHANRIGSLSWSNSILATGSWDKDIILWDVREKSDYF